MKIDKSKVIKKPPLLLCESCFKEKCNKKHFINWIRKLINLK